MTLDDYAREMGITSITLDDLIKSHRHLRAAALVHNDELRKIRENARLQGYNYGLSQATDELIHVNALRTMTVGDLVEKLGVPP